MSNLTYDQQQIPIRVSGVERSFLLRTPSGLTRDPALLINLASSAATTLDEHPYRIAADVFLAAGHRVAGFDLPCHGAWKTQHGDGLVGLAGAAAAGEDLFAQIAEAGRAVVDACIERKLARPGHIVACGTSRGGLSALHVLAAGDARVTAAAAFAPATHLAVLTEFAKLAENPIIQKGSAMATVEKIAGRSVAISINTNDVRVSTEHCMRFYSALCAAYPLGEFPLYTAKGDTHGLPDPGYQFGAGFLLMQCAKTGQA